MKKIAVFLFCFPVLCQTLAQDWQQFGSGLNRMTKNALVDSENGLLYMTGPFSQADGAFTSGIVAFDGQNFIQLQSGLDYACDGNLDAFPFSGKLFKFDNKIFVLGNYYLVNCNARFGLAHWDGQNWGQLSVPINQPTSKILTGLSSGGRLILGGDFDSLNGQAANGLVRFDGENWQPFQNGFGSQTVVRQAWEIDGILYCFGDLRLPGGPLQYNRLMKLEDSLWVDISPNSYVLQMYDLVKFKNQLYVAGRFPNNEEPEKSHLIKWDGSNWTDVGGGFLSESGDYNFSYPYDLEVYNDKLWVTGVFHQAGTVQANHVAIWDGEKWCSFQAYPHEDLYWIKSFKNRLFLGGQIYMLQGTTTHNFIEWLNDNPDNCSVAGTEEMDIAKLEIYPNPCQSMVEIKCKASSLSVMDLFGKIVLQGNLKHGQIEFDVSSLSCGIYFLKTDKGDFGKLLVER